MALDKKGLTLIELMMVFAIIGILVTVAIPPAYLLYQDSQARTQVAEAFDLLDSVKTPVSAFHSDNGGWPTKAEFDTLVKIQTGKYVASLTPATLASGFQVTATFKNNGVSPELGDSRWSKMDLQRQHSPRCRRTWSCRRERTTSTSSPILQITLR